jgi:hypothetical protein
MELKYIKNRIEKELLNVKYENWTNESIYFIISIFNNDKYKSLYPFILNILNDFIISLKKNNNKTLIYFLFIFIKSSLIKIKILIKI